MTASASRIWVVDDDRSVRFVLATALSEAGYDVASFDGAAAVHDALAARRAPDLLFTDVRMPGDSGLQLLDALKRDHPQLPVVVMSAYTDVASTAGAFRGGAHEFLSKPFDLDEAVALANDSQYGLGGAVFSTDLDEAKRVADQLEVGMANVNLASAAGANLPFGGVKRSGFGRELSVFALDEFVNKQYLYVND